MKTNRLSRTIGGAALPALCLLMAACADSDVEAPRTDPTMMRIDLEVEGGIAATRAAIPSTRGDIPAVGGEETVNDLYLFVFAYMPDGSGAHVATIGGAELGGPFVMEQSYTIPLDDYGLSPDTDYSILAVANFNPVASSGDMNTDGFAALVVGLTERQAIMRANLYTGGADTDETDNTHAPAMNNLPMSASGVWSAEEGSVQMKLRRSLVRFDVTSDVSAEYTLVSASVWGAATSTPIWNTGQRATPERMERYYGVAAAANAQTGESEIIGGLYAFENFVETPEPHDTATTCLILGLQPMVGGATQYYRVNVCMPGESQNLVRNTVYRLRLTEVEGDGAPTEGDAWQTPTASRLTVTIDAWSIDDGGLVITDGVSTLVMPTRRTNIVAEGAVHEYSVITYGTGGTLTISKSDLPAGITATLDGSRLTITATAMESGETERRGVIELSFAGLRGTITIVQSPSSALYLDVDPLELPPFASTGRTASALPIKVSASGGWLATIYNIMDAGDDPANPGFSFASGGVQTTLTSADVPGGQFNIYTTGTNPSTVDARHSFMIVSLNADPDNFSRVVVMTQNPSTDI